jgi:hypothetical protein
MRPWQLPFGVHDATAFFCNSRRGAAHVTLPPLTRRGVGADQSFQRRTLVRRGVRFWCPPSDLSPRPDAPSKRLVGSLP